MTAENSKVCDREAHDLYAVFETCMGDFRIFIERGQHQPSSCQSRKSALKVKWETVRMAGDVPVSFVVTYHFPKTDAAVDCMVNVTKRKAVPLTDAQSIRALVLSGRARLPRVVR
jgi:hypothetical protein